MITTADLLPLFGFTIVLAAALLFAVHAFDQVFFGPRHASRRRRTYRRR